MGGFDKYRKEFRGNLMLAFPIMAGSLGQVSVNFVDNLMVGRLGAESLAAVALAIAIYISFYVIGKGISYGLTPLIAEADGAKKHSRIPALLRHSMVINMTYALACGLIIYFGVDVLDHLGQDPEVVALAKPYMVISGWALLPMMFFQTLKCYSEGMSETKPAMIASLSGNVLNVILNFMLIYGYWGAPALGVKGAALGTLISRVLMVIFLLFILYRKSELWKHMKDSISRAIDSVEIKKILTLGIPTSMQMFFEVSAFAAASLIMGTLGAHELAAHQIAINLAAITFLTCTGMALATSIRVGNQLGQVDYDRMHNIGIAAIMQVTFFMFIMASIFILLRNLLPTMYISDPAVIDVAALLLVVAGFFQISDGIQVVAQGALRGLQDVKTPTVITFLAYWVVGMPISYVSARILDWGPLGVWMGLLVGLTVSAILLSRRFYRISTDLIKDHVQDHIQEVT